MQQKNQSGSTAPYIWILGVFAIRFGIGVLVQAASGAVLDEAGNPAASGIAVTGITALVTIPVFLLLYRRLEAGRSPARRQSVSAWLLLIAAGISAALGLNQMMNLLGLTRISQSFENTQTILFSGTRLMSLAVLGVFVPAAEELMFRGIIFGRLKECMGRVAAAFCVSLLFAVYHGNPVQGIYAFFMGLLLVLVYEQFENLLAPLLFHSAANIFVYLAAEVDVLGEPAGMWISCLLGFAGIIFTIWFFLREKRNN